MHIKSHTLVLFGGTHTKQNKKPFPKSYQRVELLRDQVSSGHGRPQRAHLVRQPALPHPSGPGHEALDRLVPRVLARSGPGKGRQGSFVQGFGLLLPDSRAVRGIR